MKRSLLALAVSAFAIACNQSEDNGNLETTTSTSTAESVPISTSPTSSTSLQEIWVLDSINSKAPDPKYFSQGTPYFDFNLDKKTFSGHTGCNGINGKLSQESGKLVFDSLNISKQICKDNGFEKKLLKAFNKTVTYNILNDKLYMNIEPGTVYSFRKIRR